LLAVPLSVSPYDSLLDLPLVNQFDQNLNDWTKLTSPFVKPACKNSEAQVKGESHAVRSSPSGRLGQKLSDRSP